MSAPAAGPAGALACPCGGGLHPLARLTPSAEAAALHACVSRLEKELQQAHTQCLEERVRRATTDARVVRAEDRTLRLEERALRQAVQIDELQWSITLKDELLSGLSKAVQQISPRPSPSPTPSRPVPPATSNRRSPTPSSPKAPDDSYEADAEQSRLRPSEPSGAVTLQPLEEAAPDRSFSEERATHLSLGHAPASEVPRLHESLRALEAQLWDRTIELEALRQRTAALEQSNEELTTRNADLQASVHTAPHAAHDCALTSEAYEHQLRALRSQLDASQQSVADLQAQHTARVTRLLAELQEARAPLRQDSHGADCAAVLSGMQLVTPHPGKARSEPEERFDVAVNMPREELVRRFYAMRAALELALEAKEQELDQLGHEFEAIKGDARRLEEELAALALANASLREQAMEKKAALDQVTEEVRLSLLTKGPSAVPPLALPVPGDPPLPRPSPAPAVDFAAMLDRVRQDLQREHARRLAESEAQLARQAEAVERLQAELAEARRAPPRAPETTPGAPKSTEAEAALRRQVDQLHDDMTTMRQQLVKCTALLMEHSPPPPPPATLDMAVQATPADPDDAGPPAEYAAQLAAAARRQAEQEAELRRLAGLAAGLEAEQARAQYLLQDYEALREQLEEQVTENIRLKFAKEDLLATQRQLDEALAKLRQVNIPPASPHEHVSVAGLHEEFEEKCQQLLLAASECEALRVELADAKQRLEAVQEEAAALRQRLAQRPASPAAVSPPPPDPTELLLLQSELDEARRRLDDKRAECARLGASHLRLEQQVVALRAEGSLGRPPPGGGPEERLAVQAHLHRRELEHKDAELRAAQEDLRAKEWRLRVQGDELERLREVNEQLARRTDQFQAIKAKLREQFEAHTAEYHSLAQQLDQTLDRNRRLKREVADLRAAAGDRRPTTPARDKTPDRPAIAAPAPPARHPRPALFGRPDSPDVTLEADHERRHGARRASPKPSA